MSSGDLNNNEPLKQYLPRLKDKVILLTGGGGAIGREVSFILAVDHGAKIAVCDINIIEVQETVKKIIQAGGFAISHCVDISHENEVKEWISKVVLEFGYINGLVNNAATFVFGNVEETMEQDWDRVLAVNVKGAAFCVKYVVPHLRKSGGGSIVNLGSISSFTATSGFLPYATTKGAIIQMTRCLALDLGVDNIRVNAVCPGTIDTPATNLHAQRLGLTKQQLENELNKHHFIKRLGTVRDVANAILFLLSDESPYITGTTLVVDGGFLAQ